MCPICPTRHPHTCPVLALQRWLTAAHSTDGAIFRGFNRHGKLASARLSPRAAAEIVKRVAASAGRDPVRCSGHRLRSGHCATASRVVVPERIIRIHTGHQSAYQLRRYVRLAGICTENSATSLGLSRISDDRGHRSALALAKAYRTAHSLRPLYSCSQRERGKDYAPVKRCHAVCRTSPWKVNPTRRGA